MLLSDALIKSIEKYKWQDFVMRRYDDQDYDLWKYVAEEFFGEYNGDEDYDKVYAYYEEATKKVADRLLVLEDADVDTDEELNLLLNEARLARILQRALDPYGDIKFSFKPIPGGKLEQKPKTPEELASEKAYLLINQSSGVDYSLGSSFLDKMSNAINGMVNDKVRGHTFSTYLFKLISDKEYDEISVYKVAGLNRQQFSKIRHRDYQPTKITAFALIIAMRLSLNDAIELLKYAGFTFSPSAKLDRTIEFFIRQGIYDMDIINYILYKNELPLLGSKNRN